MSSACGRPFPRYTWVLGTLNTLVMSGDHRDPEFENALGKAIEIADAHELRLPLVFASPHSGCNT